MTSEPDELHISPHVRQSVGAGDGGMRTPPPYFSERGGDSIGNVPPPHLICLKSAIVCLLSPLTLLG